MDTTINLDKAKEMLAGGVSEAQELIQEPSKIDELLVQLEGKLKEVPALGNALSDIPTLVAMVKGYITKEYTEVSPKVIATIIAAFIYLLKKKDLISDKVPVIGLADDIAVMGVALKFVEPELKAFKAWRDGGSANTVKSTSEGADEDASRITEERGEKDMSKVNDFLNEAGTFFLATVDGDQPKVRPLGAHMEMDGKVLFGIGNFKNVYRQLCANPKTEIVACKKDGHWMRYTGKAVFETDPKYAEAMLDGAPHLRKIYNEETGYKMMVFHLEDATAVDIAVMGEGESLI